MRCQCGANAERMQSYLHMLNTAHAQYGATCASSKGGNPEEIANNRSKKTKFCHLPMSASMVAS